MDLRGFRGACLAVAEHVAFLGELLVAGLALLLGDGVGDAGYCGDGGEGEEAYYHFAELSLVSKRIVVS